MIDLQKPRIAEGRLMMVAGLLERYTLETVQRIPSQWQRFARYIGNVPGEIAGATYGICANTGDDGSFDYMAGVEVSSLAGIPPELSRMEIPARRYAVFTHHGHISGIRATWNAIWNVGLPEAGLAVAHAPSFERYTDAFDARTGNGSVEIWIPLQ